MRKSIGYSEEEKASKEISLNLRTEPWLENVLQKSEIPSKGAIVLFKELLFWGGVLRTRAEGPRKKGGLEGTPTNRKQKSYALGKLNLHDKGEKKADF